MRKVWRCSSCKQMSTRFGNLKRHLERKHGGAGKPILQYISGNSIITPSDTASSLQVFPEEYTIKQTQDPFSRRNTTAKKGNDDSLDKWFNRYVEPLMKIAELRGRINSVNQSWITNPPTYFAQDYGHPFQSFHTYPPSVRVDKNSGDHDSMDINYDGISGFKADVCVKCLATIILWIGEKNTSIHDFHKCDFERENWVAKLQPWVYVIDLESKIHNLPNVLFQECKEWARWASKTNRQLYLVSTKVEPLDRNQFRNNITQSDFDELSFLSKLLVQSRIIPDDKELYDFLKIAKDRTEAVFTLKDNPGHTNQTNVIEVKCLVN